MVNLIVALHVTICISLVIVILLQHGKGADVGAVFGGSSQTVFGAGGAGNALTKATYTLALVFGLTSIFLAYAGARRVTGSIFEGRASHSSVMPAAAPKAPVVPAPAGAATPGAKK
jgi:preprotein translocase subunit SecG